MFGNGGTNLHTNGTWAFCRLVNIANRFLRIFLNLETSIRFIFPGGAEYPYLPTRLVVLIGRVQQSKWRSIIHNGGSLYMGSIGVCLSLAPCPNLCVVNTHTWNMSGYPRNTMKNNEGKYRDSLMILYLAVLLSFKFVTCHIVSMPLIVTDMLYFSLFTNTDNLDRLYTCQFEL